MYLSLLLSFLTVSFCKSLFGQVVEGFGVLPKDSQAGMYDLNSYWGSFPSREQPFCFSIGSWAESFRVQDSLIATPLSRDYRDHLVYLQRGTIGLTVACLLGVYKSSLRCQLSLSLKTNRSLKNNSQSSSFVVFSFVLFCFVLPCFAFKGNQDHVILLLSSAPFPRSQPMAVCSGVELLNSIYRVFQSRGTLSILSDSFFFFFTQW